MNTTTNFVSFYNKIISETAHEKVMHLSIFVDSSDHLLKKMYVEAAEKHNKKIMDEPLFYDAGFDLFLPKNEKDSKCYGEGTRFFGKGWEDSTINKVDFQVKCCAKMCQRNSRFYFTPFYTYARSSISKTPLRLANNQGIIDAGYRGSLIGMFDCIYNTEDSDDRDSDYYMPEYSRVLQICAPELVPIYVHIVDTIDELGPRTSRGEGGFGSTGK
jgi:dUTP pyrophosphatase